ncbi:hypothetical protein LOB97_00205 [Lactobacillus delbrueckii subsp. lactis]|uniref:hypothetical protein n=1 Tax=Lactobacillus delbrueckii TaxID=1584 RepID=UPI001E52F74D|nr:hypothetical protein [Lactobacillus delbrueckii]MCD5576423.1 hypothetical protein [Lactobacillus delbrueckii subsp. lactis]MCD5603277.1 hypothetical protein [Lactobacillus delbrueckii subsp. lactis]
MTHYETTVVFCRKSDRQLIQVHVNEPVDAIREKYVKAALGDRQLDMGKWSIDLNKNLVLSIGQTAASITEDVSVRNTDGLMKFIKPAIDTKWPSSAEH